jgi:hypothetical protein
VLLDLARNVNQAAVLEDRAAGPVLCANSAAVMVEVLIIPGEPITGGTAWRSVLGAWLRQY